MSLNFTYCVDCGILTINFCRDLNTGGRLGQVELPGDVTNLWADDRQLIALNKQLDSPAAVTVVHMKL